MSGIGALALALAAGAPFAGQDRAYDAALDEVRAGRFGAAWRTLDGATDEVVRARGRAAVLGAAGDWTGALDEATLALELAPGDLDLLYHATRALIALRAAERAAVSFERLEVAAGDPELDAEVRVAWSGILESFEREVDALAESDEKRLAAEGRARFWSAAGALAFAAVVAGALVRGRTPRGPVSNPGLDQG